MGLSLLARATLAAGGAEAFKAQLGPRWREKLTAMLATWAVVARPEQLEPEGAWNTWLILAGRGFGKTRTGAETTVGRVRRGRIGRLGLIGPTSADARDVIVEGPAGIMACSARVGFDAHYEPSKRRITWPNGATATLFSAEEPDRLRGPQHDFVWGDEPAAWDDPQAVWDQAQFGLRLGEHPQSILTTTPRPIPFIRQLMQDANVAVTRGSTYDNSANLAATFLAAIKKAYEGTRLGRQEIHAEILEDNPGALWKQSVIDALRVREAPASMTRMAIAIDPAVSANADSDLTGIVAGGLAPCWALPACQGAVHGFVMRDASGIYTPADWATTSAGLYAELQADVVVGEVNNGGDLVEANLRANGNANMNFEKVHASRGKAIRAEPISGLYQQGKVHHVGTHGKLEDEMTQWDPIAGMRSPSRMDALVWLLTELMLGETVDFTPPRPAPGNRRRI